MTPQLFYGNNGFLDWIVRLQPFHSKTGKPPITANQFYWGARIQLGCGLRVSEMTSLIKEDFDLDHKVLTIRNPKTAKGKNQFTTIMPYDISRLERFLNKFSDCDGLFPTTRSTIWKYYKNTGIIAGMNIFTVKEEQVINGIWTHLMRESCSKIYEEAGAKQSITARKLRHKPATMTDRYTKADLNAVLDFDDKHFQELQFDIKVGN